MNFPVWIIFAIVYFVFKLLADGKKATNQNRGQRNFDRDTADPIPANTRPNPSPMRSIRDELREAFREFESTLETPRKNPTEKPMDKGQDIDAVQDNPSQPTVLNKGRVVLEKPKTYRNSNDGDIALSVKPAEKPIALNFNSDAVLNGVIMSEVLGLPKSRQNIKRI